MGNKPSEYNGAHCSICNTYLPPCKSFDGFTQQRIDRKVDTVNAYVFLGGRYYRLVGGPYFCPNCFWKPKNDYIQKQEEQRRRREEERRREQQAREERQRREEEERRRERERQEELRRREQEAREEAARQEALRQERMRKEEERKRREKEQMEFEEKASKKKSISDRFLSWSLKKDKEKFQHQVQVKAHRNPQAIGVEGSKDIPKMKINDEDEYELWSEDLINDDDEVNPEPNELTRVTSQAVSLVSKLHPSDDYIDVPWLKVVQTQLLNHYATANSLSAMELEVLLYYLSCIRIRLSDVDHLYLTKMMCSLSASHPLDYERTLTRLDDDLPGRFMIAMLQSGYELNYCNTECMRQCLSLLVSNCVEDAQLQAMITEATSKFWSIYDRFLLLKKCNEKNFSYSEQKHILHLVQIYDILPIDVFSVLDAVSDSNSIIKSLVHNVETEPNVHLTDLINEIQSTNLVEPAILEEVNVVVAEVDRMLKRFNIDLDYNKRLTESELATAKSYLKSCTNGSKLDSARLASAILTLCCAVKKSQGYCPRTTQLIALTLLMISGNKSVSRLLEVMTGEGKSTVIAMLAAVLAIQGKHVDVITSSPILACRDAEEWESFFTILDLKATHNTAISGGAANDPDKERQRCYQHPIVYGTVSNFAADILREEFEQKNVRCGRKFDAVIADEVDLLMLDEGVQFTYLSHKSAILYHMEPVVATVWNVVGQYSPVTTTSGEIIYMGPPKLFSDSIFESIHAEECEVEESSQFLVIAEQNGLLDKATVEMLMLQDQNASTTESSKKEHQELKKDAMSTIGSNTIIATLQKLEEYLPYTFEAYIINGDGILELASKELSTREDTGGDKELSESEEKLPVVNILVIGNGLACTLNTQLELKDGSLAKIEATLKFSNEPDSEKDQKIPQLKLPLFLKEFVENQLPVFVNSALKCLEMVQNREYAVSSDGKIIPVDFLNSGVMQMNKKWGGGLQQMLEMKHNLSLSSMSVVTNFLSHMELFSRYKNSGVIFGLSGTLDVDSPSTAKVLFDLFEVRSCVIPTHKRRKLYEKPAIIVEEGSSEWFKKIMAAINEAVRVEAWKKGRAVLVLCEDIKTAVALNEYITDKEGYDKDKVHLYARSNSKELQSIQHKFGPGEIAIATNLAGRGTNIKLTEDVKKSGGLLCLVTFLARNRRVELQAFGRSARKGEPGSVQCVLNAASLPVEYQGLDFATIRKLRAQKEHMRLDELLNSEVKEVMLKEVLFKRHCKFLKAKNADIGQREDKSITIDAINESWGQWLLMKSEKIEHLEEKILASELTESHSKWPITSFYHEIKFGNKLLIEGEHNASSAYQHYTSSIKMEPRYVAIAYYNRAYATIAMRKDGYMDDAIRDLDAAEKSLESYISEVAYLLQCVPMVTRIKAPPPNDSDTADKPQGFDINDSKNEVDNFSTQMQLRIQIFGFVRDKIREAIGKIKHFKEEGEDIEAEALGVFSLIPSPDFVTNQELYTMWSLGMEIVFSVKKKPRFCWEGLVVLLIGIAQIVAGAALAVFTVGAAANFGMGLISEGISDCIDGVVAMSTGEFSWAQWGISKAIGIAVSLASGGIARFASKGFKAFKVASKLGKELKAIPKIAKNSWGLAAKTNFKNVAKFVGKTLAEDGIMRGLSYAQNAAFKAIYEKIGMECKDRLRSNLHKTFSKGKMGQIVDNYFVYQLPAAYVKDNKMSPVLRKKAHDFFSNVGDEVVEMVVQDTFIKEQLTSASLSLLSELSNKHKGGKAGYLVLEAGEMSALVLKTMKDLNDLLERLVPETERVCQEFADENPPQEPVADVSSYSNLTCVYELKNELVDLLGNVFSTAVASFLEQNLGSVVNHGMNRTVHHAGRKVLKKFTRTDRTYDAIQAGQKANFIRSVDPSELHRHVPPIGSAMVNHYTSEIVDTRKPGSVLELKIAVEHYGQGVTIFQEKKGKFVRDCSVEPSAAKKSGANIQLLYTPPSDDKSVGHYDVIVKGKVIKIKSEDSNCLFQAFAGGRHPDLTSTEQSLQELQRHALEVRKTVAASIEKNPQLWVEHISHRLEIIQLRNGNRFALLGAGPKNNDSKVSTGMYKELVNKNELHTAYEQENGIQCKAVRKFEKDVKSDGKGNLQSADGTPLTRMTSLEVHMDGLNFDKNVGRCWDTKPVTGMIKRDGGKARDSEVSFHVCPSEAGANAGNAYANAVMASSSYNKMERDLWTPSVKKMIGTGDFSMTVKIETEPLIPKGVKFKDFLKDLNNERKNQGKDPIDATNEAALEQRLQEIQALEPRSYRVAKMVIEIKAGSKSESFTMNRDVDLFVPSNFTNKNQPHEIPGENLSKSRPKITEHKFDRPPNYRKEPPKQSSKKRKAFEQRVEKVKKAFK